MKLFLCPLPTENAPSEARYAILEASFHKHPPLWVRLMQGKLLLFKQKRLFSQQKPNRLINSNGYHDFELIEVLRSKILTSMNHN